MSNEPSLIVGAGLAGLIAAHVFPNCPIYEASTNTAANHRALLRFRSRAVSDLTGIPFREVQVQKGIWNGENFVAPSIAEANIYASKVTPDGETISARSIWNLETATRYVAPEDFVERLLEKLAPRILFDRPVDFGCGVSNAAGMAPCISTIPLPTLLSGIEPEFHLRLIQRFGFQRRWIKVHRWKVDEISPGRAAVDLFQTVYVTDVESPVYRVSITGDVIIVEGQYGLTAEHALRVAQQCLQIARRTLWTYLGETPQNFGKIVSLPTDLRREILLSLTRKHRIYSLGRFATWRNVLLDDVVDDAFKIKAMMADDYRARLFSD